MLNNSKFLNISLILLFGLTGCPVDPIPPKVTPTPTVIQTPKPLLKTSEKIILEFGPGSKGFEFGPGSKGLEFGPGSKGLEFGPGSKGFEFGPGTKGLASLNFIVSVPESITESKFNTLSVKSEKDVLDKLSIDILQNSKLLGTARFKPVRETAESCSDNQCLYHFNLKIVPAKYNLNIKAEGNFKTLEMSGTIINLKDTIEEAKRISKKSVTDVKVVLHKNNSADFLDIEVGTRDRFINF